MNSSKFYRVSSANVMHEIIDGEAVIVNLENGCYYSLDNVGAYVWNQLVKGISIEKIVEALCTLYTDRAVQIQYEMENLVLLLIEEGLIVEPPTAPNGIAMSPSGDVATVEEILPPEEYLTLQLHKYSDMGDLLLLDPIYDVNETDWPNSSHEAQP